jgi:hypothetical protein
MIKKYFGKLTFKNKTNYSNVHSLNGGCSGPKGNLFQWSENISATKISLEYELERIFMCLTKKIKTLKEC